MKKLLDFTLSTALILLLPIISISQNLPYNIIASTSASNIEQANEPEIQFTVIAPINFTVNREVSETFPIRNYVFFNLGSTKIPNRYVLLKKDQVKDFKEDQLEVFTPKYLSDRSKRQMTAYYNILNILGDRMQKDKSSNINLIGSSEKGQDDAKAMAESVKYYLVNIFGINESRIATVGRAKPKLPSEQPGSKNDIKLLREEDRRVSIETTATALLMEFRNGPDAPLRPVAFIAKQEASPETYVIFKVDGSKEVLSSWSIQIRDEKGSVQYLGPYSSEKVSIPAKAILGKREAANFKVTMIGKSKTNQVTKKEADLHLERSAKQVNEVGLRFTVLYDFNTSTTMNIYEKYLSDIVTPKIPKNGKLIIHGYTDVIGDEFSNQKLSMARAEDVQKIVDASLSKTGKTDVTYEVYGFGENQALTPFDNKYPEERFYNRTVIIDIVYHK